MSQKQPDLDGFDIPVADFMKTILLLITLAILPAHAQEPPLGFNLILTPGTIILVPYEGRIAVIHRYLKDGRIIVRYLEPAPLPYRVNPPTRRRMGVIHWTKIKLWPPPAPTGTSPWKPGIMNTNRQEQGHGGV